jgi:hypothetical protein
MINDYLDRLQKKKLIISDCDIDIHNYIDIISQGVIGSNRISQKDLRIIHKNDVYTTIDNIVITYTEYAKLLLYKALQDIGSKRFRNARNEALSIQGLYSQSGTYYDYCYIDITDNHFSVYKHFLYSIYNRLKFLSDGSYTLFCDINIPKQVKRYCYGVMRSYTFTKYKKKSNNDIEYKIVRSFHSLHNRDVSNLINDLSQSIGFYAVKYFGAVYVNTDGFILPAKNSEAFIDFLKELGFSSKIKSYGNVSIKAIGVYMFFDTDKELKSKNFDRIKAVKDYNNLTNIDLYNWLIPVYKKKIALLQKG